MLSYSRKFYCTVGTLWCPAYKKGSYSRWKILKKYNVHQDTRLDLLSQKYNFKFKNSAPGQKK